MLKMTTSWKEEGIIEGKRDGLRESTLMILEKRFGPVPEDLALIVRTTNEPRKLAALILSAAVEPSLDSLRATLAKKAARKSKRPS